MIPSPYQPNIELFNNPASNPDFDFVTSWLNEPLHLHKEIMVAASTLIEESLGEWSSITQNHASYVEQFEWFFEAPKAVDRKALVKVLHFCYGEPLTVGVEDGECCAVIAALFQLQVKCAPSVVPHLFKFAVTQAQCNVAVGAALLMASSGYSHCCDSHWCTLDHALAAIVLTSENMCMHYDTVVKDCLLNLPPHYLDLAQYGAPHTT